MPSELKTDTTVRTQPGFLVRRWGSVCARVLLGVLLNYFAEFRPHISFAFPFLIVIASIIAAALHEAGHAVGAAVTGFDLLMFAVWPTKVG